MEPQARTSTMLNPTGSLDLRRLTYSLALVSPASKWVNPFCSGTCFATFSLWKLKNTKRPKKRERPVLRLITTGALSSAFTPPPPSFLADEVFVDMEVSLDEGDLGRGLRPWNDGVATLWRLPWVVVVVEKTGVNKAEAEAMVVLAEGGLIDCLREEDCPCDEL
ncbi:hypothetical protein HRI_002187000 [Hibiscus trionum]|uniref:Uncharacterized protein n=1 Tax=Hibiscus trionum TaxID=183268 RepID=A0A9W7HXF3_HIBTR|nr:hypothetical protein HRI_002187000 [Hibiscus trionum]